MDSKLEEQKSAIIIQLLDREKTLPYFLQRFQKRFLKPGYPAQPFIARFHSLERAGYA